MEGYRAKADRSTYGITSSSQAKKKTDWVGSERETALLAGRPHRVLISPRRITYCSWYVFGFWFLVECDKRNRPEGKAEIIRELERNSVTILVGETGSGKTTREIKFIYITPRLSLIHGKRYPSTSSRQGYHAGNASQSPSRGGLLLGRLRLVLPRNKGCRWVHLSDIRSVLTNVVVPARRSNSSPMECWFGN